MMFINYLIFSPFLSVCNREKPKLADSQTSLAFIFKCGQNLEWYCGSHHCLKNFTKSIWFLTQHAPLPFYFFTWLFSKIPIAFSWPSVQWRHFLARSVLLIQHFVLFFKTNLLFQSTFLSMDYYNLYKENDPLAFQGSTCILLKGN